MRSMVTLFGIAVVLYIAWMFWKKNIRAVLIAKISEKFGDIPGLADKSTEELQEMWESTKG